MTKVQQKQGTCKLRGNISFKLTTTVTAVINVYTQDLNEVVLSETRKENR